MCFDACSHLSGVKVAVDFVTKTASAIIVWACEITEQMKRTYQDLQKRLDYGACAIALLVMREFGSLVTVEVSAKANGFDYYLSEGKTEDDLIFNYAAYLEVSGIEEERGTNTVARRINSKRKRRAKFEVQPSQTSDLPTYVCVVEFATPKCKVILL